MTLPAFIQRLYAAAVWLYPWRFRASFGDEMQAVFAEVLAGACASGRRAVMALCARELVGLARGLPAQYARAWAEEMARMRGQPVQPSWAQAVAASGPGLLIVSGYWLFKLEPSRYQALSVYGNWLMLGVFLAAGLWALRRGWTHSAWAWPAVGLLVWVLLVQLMRAATNAALLLQHGLLVAAAVVAVGIAARAGLRLPRGAWALLGLMAALVLARGAGRALTQTYFGADDPLGYRLYVILAGLLPAALMSLLLVAGRMVARWHGLSAVLLLLGPCALLIDLLVDPTYGVRSAPLPAQAVLAPVLRSLLYGGLLILAPVGLLRARTAAGQARAVAAGLLIALVPVIAIPYLYWRQQMLDLVTLAVLALGVLTALVAYGWDGAARPAPAALSAK